MGGESVAEKEQKQNRATRREPTNRFPFPYVNDTTRNRNGFLRAEIQSQDTTATAVQLWIK